MAQTNTFTPRRYWGPGSNGDFGNTSGSPSQASAILARINERARARKAGKTPVVNGPCSEARKEDTPSIEPSEETRKLTQVIANDEQLSIESRKKKLRQEEYGSKESSTSKDETITAEKEVLSDGHRKKKKKDKRKDVGREDQTLEESVNITVNDEHISCDMEAEIPKKKKKKKREKEISNIEEVHATGKEEVLLNGIDSLSGTEEGALDAQCKKKKKKKKKKEMEDQEDKKSSLEETNCVSDTLTDDVFMKSSQKRKKKNRIRNTMDDESQVEEGNDVKESKDVQEDENNVELPKKKKKRKREKCENEENITLTGDNLNSLENESKSKDLSMPETKKKKKKKKKKKDKREQADEENNVQIGEINECVSNVVESETVTYVEERHEKTESQKGDEVEHTQKATDSEVLESKSELDTSMTNKEVKVNNKKRKKRKKKKAAKVQDREIGGFTLMREVKSTNKEKLQRTLPHWLANPTVIGRDLHSDGTPIGSIQGLDASLKTILEDQKIQQFFPVQKAVIPEILSSISSLSTRYRPRDICVSAPTGSGKTLAYVLPIIQALKDRTVPRIRALVLLPVQELAIQVYKVFQTYRKGSKLKVGIAVGQSTFQKEQASLVAQDYGGYCSVIDILVATPGRLDDHLKFTKGIDLSSLRYLVVDEADRMLAAEGGEWVNCIEQAAKHQEAASENVLIGGFQEAGPTQFPQVPIHRLLFSATLSHDPEQLQHMTLYRPKLFTVSETSSTTAGAKKKEFTAGTVVGQYTRPAELKEEYALVDESVKPLVLHHLITMKRWRRVLVFTNSLQTTHKLAVLLAAMSEGLRVAEFSSSQKNKRHQIVSQFTSGKIDILISSDAMARGLDIPDIEHVVSYDVTSVNTYVHRIGRTARAGKSGTALSLVTKDVMNDFRTLLSNGGENVTELTVSTEELEPYESLYINALAKMKEIILQEQQKRREEMETSISGNKQNGRRDWRYKGNSTHSGVRKFVKRLQHSRIPHKIR